MLKNIAQLLYIHKPSNKCPFASFCEPLVISFHAARSASLWSAW